MALRSSASSVYSTSVLARARCIGLKCQLGRKSFPRNHRTACGAVRVDAGIQWKAVRLFRYLAWTLAAVCKRASWQYKLGPASAKIWKMP